MRFVQIIEFKTRRIDEFTALLNSWVEQNAGRSLVTRALQTRDRDQENVYLNIVEFPSYEQAQENSDRPETAEFAAQLAALCDGPPVFRNLDLLDEMHPQG
ncbi:hypothetical protein AB0D08_15905 [Kitasatospora sp. NPDC048540]|uniref:hypothetical protein n=1 Tax=unclassified Kitasatospora TaxID=2633591 RepID=UPI00053B836E|nr:hypothetical protein [Kitasatospora sp. MBT63]